MITYLKIDGFKSFKDFSMIFTPFTVVAGANASGKSNLFDALKLLSDLSHRNLKEAFLYQRGEAIELFTQYDKENYADEVRFEIELLLNKTVRDSWGGTAELKYTRLRYKIKIARKKDKSGIDELFVKEEHLEPVRHQQDEWVKKYIDKSHLEQWRPKVKAGRRGKPYIYTELRNGIPTIKMPQDGRRGGKETPADAVSRTVLSGIDDVSFPHVFAVKEEMKNWKFLQLNPDDLREPVKKQIGMSDIISQTGKNLASALFRLKKTDNYILTEISRRLNNLLPNLVEVDVTDDNANNQYLIKISSDDGKEYSSRVLSEGTLRLLTLCIFLYDDFHNSLLCYEEPENGIHPFRIKFLTELLYDLSVDFADYDMPLRQMIINTHSPKLVGELMKRNSDNRMSIWFSKMNTLLFDLNYTRKKINITKLIPVTDSANAQLSMDFPELNINPSESKLTMSQVKQYLETVGLEQNF